jgi:hypothetical protein
MIELFKGEEKSSILNINEFLFKTSIDTINFFEVEEFILKSELEKKLNFFYDNKKNEKLNGKIF